MPHLLAFVLQIIMDKSWVVTLFVQFNTHDERLKLGKLVFDFAPNSGVGLRRVRGHLALPPVQPEDPPPEENR